MDYMFRSYSKVRSSPFPQTSQFTVLKERDNEEGEEEGEEGEGEERNPQSLVEQHKANMTKHGKSKSKKERKKEEEKQQREEAALKEEKIQKVLHDHNRQFTVLTDNCSTSRQLWSKNEERRRWML